MTQAQLDIVIPVHDNLPWLQMCLTALHAYTETPYTVWLVDNASETQEMKAYLDDLAASGLPTQRGIVRALVRVLRLATNESFSASVNAGVRAGSAPTVVILNSDVLVSKGWDAAFLQDLAHQDVGLTGARCAPGTCAGVQSDPNASARHAGPSLVQTAQGRDVDPPTAPALIFFCVALRRSTWEKLGELDGKTCRGWGGAEDLDYSWRVIDAGLRCVASAAYVVHGCSQTYAATGWTGERKAAAEKANLEALVTKHGLDRVRKGTGGGRPPSILLTTFHRADMSLIRFQEALCQSMHFLGGAGVQVTFLQASRTVIDAARNLVVVQALELSQRRWGSGADELDYVVMCDDDHTFPRDAIVRLISSGKPIVGAWAYRRHCNYTDPTRADHTSCVFRFQNPDDPEQGVVSMEGLEGSGLLEVDAIGHGLVAVRLDVLKAMTAKYGKKLYEFARVGEDIGFCIKARRAGFSVWVDTDLVIGHVGSPPVIDQAWARRWQQECAAAGGPKR